MSRKLPYSTFITAAAVAIARKTFQQRGVRLVRKFGRAHIVRTVDGEGLAIVANQRNWA